MPDPGLLAQIHAASFTTSPRPWPESEIAALLEKSYVFLCAREGGFLIGQAIAGEAEILTLAVAPEARRKGLGQSLVSAFLQEAARRGAESAFLEVSAENHGAIALYQAAGFAKAGLRRGYYHSESGAAVDALVLSRAISPLA